MQDNTPIYKAKSIKDQFKNHVIPRLKWPPYSHDLNPIENIQAILKSRITERWPHLLDQGRSVEALEALKRAIIYK